MKTFVSNILLNSVNGELTQELSGRLITLKMMEFINHFDSAGNGVLLNRADGERIRTVLLSTLNSMGCDRILLVDFRGVSYAVYPALREVIVPFVSPVAYGMTDKYPVFCVDDFEAEFAESLTHVARDLKVVILTIDGQGKRCFLGRLTATEQETLAIVYSQERVTALILSEQQGIALTAASNRLRNLHRRLLVRREESRLARGGREFVYQSLI